MAKVVLNPILRGIFFTIAMLSGFLLRGQDLSVEDMVYEMYDVQAEILFNMKVEAATRQGDVSEDEAYPAVFADLKLNGTTRSDFIASRYLALEQFRTSGDEIQQMIAAYFDAKQLVAEAEFPPFNSYLKAYYEDASTATVAAPVTIPYITEAQLLPKRPKRVKISSETTDPSTGEKMWIFSNGLRVIYKQVKGLTRFDYVLMIRGGYGDIRGLRYGEGAYVADLLPLERVAGEDGIAFRNMLSLNGITMTPSVSLLDMRLKGSSPNAGLELLLKSLLALSRDRAVDSLAYERFRNQPRWQTKEALIDSLLRPQFVHTSTKHVVDLSEDLCFRAEQEYFGPQFGKVNDGIIVLQGDIDPTALKKVLCRYLGGFRTSRRASIRTAYPYFQRAGVVPCDAITGESEALVAMSAQMDFTTDNYLCGELARMLLRDELHRAFPGRNLEVTTSYEVFPIERILLVAGVYVDRPSAAMPTILSTVERVMAEPIDEEILKNYKAQFLGMMTESAKAGDVFLDQALLRYSAGKDLSNYKSKLEKITVEQVRLMVKSLWEGGRVEYRSR